MAVRLDEARRTLVAGGVEWPFRLDLQRGTATVETAGGKRRVRPQRWAEKRRLAQFAGWGEEFFREQLWNMCVRPGDAAASEEEREAILELAVWLSCGGRVREALPYDRLLLDNATFVSCRALGVAPNQLDSLPAYEVEALWRCAQQNEPGEMPLASQTPQEFSHQIRIVPDPPVEAAAERAPAGASAPAQAAHFEAPHPEQAQPVTEPAAATGGQPRRKAAFLQTKATSGTKETQSIAPDRPRTAGTSPRTEAAKAGGQQSAPPEGEARPAAREQEMTAAPAARPVRRTMEVSKFRVVMGPPASLRAMDPAALEPEFAAPVPAERAAQAFPGIAAAGSPEPFFLTPTAQAGGGRAPTLGVAAVDLPAPSAGAAAAAQEGPSLDTIADAFAERLQTAAAEMGILEER
jgi:hypothetical protein